MAKTAQRNTRTVTKNHQQLAALSTLLGVMMKASRLCEELDNLTSSIGGSLEELAEKAGIPYDAVHSAFARPTPRRRAKPWPRPSVPSRQLRRRP